MTERLAARRARRARRWRLVRRGVLVAVCLGCGAGVLWLRPAPQVPLPAVAVPAWPAAERATGPLRLTVFGTSLSFEAAWSEALAGDLARCTGREVRLERIAAPGMGSTWGLTQIDRVVGADPDLILIEFATNDADRLDGVSLATSRAQHLRLLDQLRDRVPDAGRVLMSMNPVTGPVQKVLRGRLPQYNALYGDLAAATGAGFVDLARVWQQAMDAPDWQADRIPDGVHPVPDAVSEIIVPPLRAALMAAWRTADGATSPCAPGGKPPGNASGHAAGSRTGSLRLRLPVWPGRR